MNGNISIGTLEKQWEKFFPELLKKCLEARGMTQRELAEKMGVTEASISRYANGQRIPKITTMQKMCMVLSMQFVMGAGNRNEVLEDEFN